MILSQLNGGPVGHFNGIKIVSFSIELGFLEYSYKIVLRKRLILAVTLCKKVKITSKKDDS